MTDPFQQAVADTLSILKNIRSGFGAKPTASASALDRLRALASRSPARPKAEPREMPASPVEPAPGETQAVALFAKPRRARGETAEPEPAAAPDLPPAPHVGAPDTVKVWTLETLREAALACVKCPHLVRSRTQVVFGVGNPNAELMFVGEAPGADEDLQGEPFVGKAGQLLTKIIVAMGLSRGEVYIGNVLKCRPDMPPGSTGNRKPRPEEMRTCLPWLEKQIDLIRPRVMVALGATAVEGLLGNTEPVGRLRGRWLDFKGIPVMVTYHPAYLLRNQSIAEKRKVWEDMLQVLEKLGRPITEKQRQYFTKSAGAAANDR